MPLHLGSTYAVAVYFRSFYFTPSCLDASLGCRLLIAENVATFCGDEMVLNLMLSDGRIYGGEFNVKFDASRHNSHLDDANRVKFGLNPR